MGEFTELFQLMIIAIGLFPSINKGIQVVHMYILYSRISLLGLFKLKNVTDHEDFIVFELWY